MTRTPLLLFLALMARIVTAQQPLTNDSVLKLAKAGMSDDVIVGVVNSQPSSFALSTDDVIALKSAGVSEKVIAAMLVRKGGAPVVAAGSDLPREIGVYYKKAGVWTDVAPEVVNFKTGGVLKTIATEGILKGDVNGNIKGSRSKLDVTSPIELLVYAPEGAAITEYQLLLLHVQSNSREFRTLTGGVFHSSGGASRDAIEFEGKKVAPRTYSITLTSVKGGEYGLFPPASGDGTGSSGRLGKLYTFHVIE